uniref:AT-hook motif nuclear-localized protein n=1 Tax=Rhizophora mucronata TaxID=61149 RepID=A0A2P2KJH9_RHIMU
MDSREPPQPTQVLSQPPPQQQPPPPPNMLLGPTSSYSTNSTHPSMISAHGMAPTGGVASSGGFPFNSVGPRPQSKPLLSDGGGGGGGMNAVGGFDGSSPQSSGGMRFSIEPAKKKRGRPRKYTPDGNIALGLSPTPISSGTSVGLADSGGGGTPGVASEPPVKRNRGRPPGSGKKQLDALGGVGGVGFTPHVITVKAGEVFTITLTTFSLFCFVNLF